MSWLSDFLVTLPAWVVLVMVVVDFVLVAGFMIWVLFGKTDATSAVAWLLLIFFLPFIGVILYLLFGYQHVYRKLRRKKKHRVAYPEPRRTVAYSQFTQRESAETAADALPRRDPSTMESLVELGKRFGASEVTLGNHVEVFFDGPSCFERMFEAIRQARHHIHLQVYIFRPDDTGRRFVDALAQRARDGVEVRLLYDSMGTPRFPRQFLVPLHDAGGKSSVFLPISLLRRRFQINMRNHRKIMVVDGQVGFLGGLNIGDEYVGLSSYFGFWRDTHLCLRGPAVIDLQRIFAEDWDFAADEYLDDGDDSPYYHAVAGGGAHAIQILDSGPDLDYRAIREVIFAALLKARRRLWIASPYFVPDTGLLDALRLAAFSGVDVRILCQLKPDRYIPMFAARYYFQFALEAGVQVYQYAKGMMHSKVILIDDDFASVGTANFDNRSMFLNFEVNSLIYSPAAVEELARAFEIDFAHSRKLDPDRYAKRRFATRLVENAARLLSPIL